MTDHISRSSLLVGLAAICEAFDPELERHQRIVSHYALGFARHLGVANPEGIGFAAHVHDIGKITVVRAVLRKPTRLSGSEWSMIRDHPLVGEYITRRLDPDNTGLHLAVRHHHERWDGSGYPDGLVGGAIPLAARILSLVDALDTMVFAHRNYKAHRHTVESAVAEIMHSRGTQFDPELATSFSAWVVNPEVHAPDSDQHMRSVDEITRHR